MYVSTHRKYPANKDEFFGSGVRQDDGSEEQMLFSCVYIPEYMVSKKGHHSHGSTPVASNNTA